MKTIKLLLLLVTGLFLVGCDMPPSHKVIDTGDNKIYMVEDRQIDDFSTNKNNRRYMYYISDSAGGFILFSDKKFAIGDIITFDAIPSNSQQSLEQD